MGFPVHQHEVHDELVPIDAGVVLLFRSEGNQFFRYRAHLVVVGIHAFVIQHELVRDAVPVFGRRFHVHALAHGRQVGTRSPCRRRDVRHLDLDVDQFRPPFRDDLDGAAYLVRPRRRFSLELVDVSRGDLYLLCERARKDITFRQVGASGCPFRFREKAGV